MSRPARYPIATPAISGTYEGLLDANPDRLRTFEEASRFRTSSEVASPNAYAASSLSPRDSAVKAATLAWGPADRASCWMFVGVVELALLASGISVAGLWPTDSSAIFCGSVLLLSIDVLRYARPMGARSRNPGASHRRHRKRKRGNAVATVANRRHGNARQHINPLVRIEI